METVILPTIERGNYKPHSQTLLEKLEELKREQGIDNVKQEKIYKKPLYLEDESTEMTYLKMQASSSSESSRSGSSMRRPTESLLDEEEYTGNKRDLISPVTPVTFQAPFPSSNTVPSHFLVQPPIKQKMVAKKKKTSKHSYLIPSKFEKVKPSVVFTQATVREEAEEEVKGAPLQLIAKTNKDNGLTYKMPPSAVEFNVVKNAFKRAGFKKTSKWDFNMLWGKKLKYDEYARLNEQQKVNHFPGTWILGRKDNLHRMLTSSKRTHGKAYNFFPYAYLLPEETSYLENEWNQHPNTLFIVKPKASSCGRGIRVVSSMARIKKDSCLVQRYIDRPLLINGHKWDLRLYVVVTSYDPLVIYLFDDGLCRFATVPYDRKKLKNRFIHLTNYSINKNSKNFEKNKDATQNSMGSKWSLKGLYSYLEEQGHDVNVLKTRMKQLIIKTIIGSESHVNQQLKRFVKQKGQICYEVFGFDILVDEKLKPWLIEINVSPSLSSSSPMDKSIKGRLITQTFHMVGPKMYSRSKLAEKKQEEKHNRLLGTSRSNRYKSSHKRTLFELKRINNLEHLTEDDINVITHFEDEYTRRGDFERIFPTKTTYPHYVKYFESERYNNVLMHLWNNSTKRQKLKQHHEKYYTGYNLRLEHRMQKSNTPSRATSSRTKNVKSAASRIRHSNTMH